MHVKLFIPGPVDVRPEVLEAMSQPMIGHRTKDATAIQERISKNMQKILSTENTILLSTSSGTGMMEALIRNSTKKKAAVFSVGAFGKRWYELAVGNNVAADLFESAPGEPTTPEMVKEAIASGEYDVVTVTHNETSSGIMNPVEEIGKVIKESNQDILFLVDAVSSLGGYKIEMDKCNIDGIVTSTQKCIGLPPGLAICAVTDRLYERAKTVEHRGYYFDIVKLYDRVKKDYQYPSTPSLPHMYALDVQLDYILNEQGLENRFEKHARQAKMVRDWALKYFDLFAKDGYRSNTVTCITNTIEIDVPALNTELKKRGFMISNGYGVFKNKTFRIAHMADCKDEDLKELLSNIEDILALEAK